MVKSVRKEKEESDWVLILEDFISFSWGENVLKARSFTAFLCNANMTCNVHEYLTNTPEKQSWTSDVGKGDPDSSTDSGCFLFPHSLFCGSALSSMKERQQ